MTDEVVYLSAMEEAKYTIAQANATIDGRGRITDELVSCRKGGNFVMTTPDQVEFIDVSPKQLVSVAAALVPFLENDDANRALMGSNMQRQAVPLLQPEAPLVGTGMEDVVARDSGSAIAARRSGVVDQVDATRIVIRATEETDPTKPGIDIYRLKKFQRSNQSTCINQRPLVKVGDLLQKGDIIADGPSTQLGELALGKNALVAFMPWNGYNFEDSILISERIVRDDVFTSIHIEEFETMARDTKLGPEEITRDIPNVGEENLKNLDEAGIVYIGAEVEAGDILVGKVTPKGETPMTPEEKLLRAIFGEKAADVRDTSLRVPPGVTGTIVEVRVFNRHGVDKDQRAMSIEKAEEERLAEDRDDELAILERNIFSRLSELLLHKTAAHGPKGHGRRHQDHAAGAGGDPAPSMVADRSAQREGAGRDRSAEEAVRRIQAAPRQALRRQGRKAAPRRRTGAGRDEDGQGVRGGEAQAAAGRQDGRPSRQQGRDQPHPADRRHAASGRRHAGRRRAQSAGRAFAHECRPDSGNPSGLGLRRSRPPDRRRGRQGAAATASIERAAQDAETRLWQRRTSGELDEQGLIELGDNLRAGVPMATPVFDGAKENDIVEMLDQAGLNESGQVTLYDGRTGEAFKRQVTVGYIYMLKLHHLVDDKIHARSIGPYSLVTQQPLGGKAQFGGQRFGEMEVWALEAYGAAYTLQEILTVKSDDVAGRTKVYEAIVRGEDTFEAGIPEIFNVLVKEMRSLGAERGAA